MLQLLLCDSKTLEVIVFIKTITPVVMSQQEWHYFIIWHLYQDLILSHYHILCFALILSWYGVYLHSPKLWQRDFLRKKFSPYVYQFWTLKLDIYQGSITFKHKQKKCIWICIFKDLGISKILFLASLEFSTLLKLIYIW